MEVKERYISKEGLSKLQNELKGLKSQRVEITQKIKEAREYGDLSENAEYQEARTKQSFIEGRIEEIETVLKTAKLINRQDKDNGEVAVGSDVMVSFAGKERTYHITGSNETSPGEGKISNESPLGHALMGKKAGETAKLETPEGSRTYKVVKIL